MEDEDGTCLLDVLCDPQALNHFLHGTNELQTEDLLISASSGETSLFTDAPSPVSLLGGGQGSPDTPPPGCVDLSFLEEALLSSPEGGAEPRPAPSPAPPDPGCPPTKGEEEEEEEEEESCDILQQSLQEADITEQTMALEAGLTLYSPAPPLPAPPPPPPPFVPKLAAPPRDTQAVVEPPQPSLLAVGPGCPSLKPTSPQVMGLLPGNVFPAPPPDASFSLSPVQGSSMILHKAASGVSGRALMAPPPGLVLHRAPLPIQPKLPISIQPRLVQISPKPPGPKPTPGLTFVQGTAPPNILLSPPAGPKPAGPKPVAPPTLSPLPPPKPVSLQLVNQGGSFLLQPHGLFQGQNPFLVSSQCPVTISQPAGAAGPLLTPAQAVAPSCGQLVDSSQILTVPQRQLKFGPVFAPTGPLALPQATLLSGPLQLHSAPPAVFQMPAQLARTFTAGGQQATLVQGPTLRNHITLINSSGVLPSDLASISIVNRPPVVGGPLAMPFAATAPAADGQLSLQGASVVLLPEEKSSTDETFQLSQRLGPVLQQVPVLPPPPPPAGPQSSSPPVVTVLQPPPEPAVVPDLTGETPKQAMLPADVEEVTRSMSQNQAFMKHLQEVRSSPTPPIPSELLVGSLPLVPMEPLTSPAASETESGPALAAAGSLSREASPLLSDSQDAAALGSPSSAVPAATESPTRQEPRVQYPGSSQSVCQAPPPDPAPHPPVHDSPSPLSTQQDSMAVSPSAEGRGSVKHAVQQHQQNQAPAALPSPAVLSVLPPQDTGPAPHNQQTPPKAGPDEQQEEELTPARRSQRFQEQLCSDHAAVQNPITGQAFSTLKQAVQRLLPYHVVAGAPPSQLDFSKVDQEFQSVSGFLLKRTKDMMNKYRQLLVRETQQESPSAEMVMLERLFLQAERYSLAEDQRRARKDPESFVVTLGTSASSPQGAASSRSPASPPAWTRPPGLKTYCSSSRGALRLTIKQESGSRKVVHNSACEQGLKRDHTGQLTNGGGGGGAMANGVAQQSRPGERLSNGAPPKDALCPKTKACSPPVAPPTDGAAPKPKCYRLEATERRLSPPPAPPLPPPPPTAPPPTAPPPLQDDNMLSEHLQSAIDSILELQRLQGPAPPGRVMPGHAPSLDTPITSILKG